MPLKKLFQNIHGFCSQPSAPSVFMVINPHHKPKHKLPYVELRGHRSLPGYGVRGCCPEGLVAVDSGRIKETKTKESAANVYVPPDLMAELNAWMERTAGNCEDWLFPASRRRGSAGLSPISQNNYRNRILKPTAEKADIPNLDLLTLRRTCATHFGQKANTKDTQMQMRHADPLTTLTYYQQSIPESVKKAAVELEAEILKKQTGEQGR
ncbi:MAG: site-specific integrase, partial [Bryobacteraceae bacterium]|jgi:hypothetical protein